MVVVVGAFVPFLRELKRRKQPFLVLEQDPLLSPEVLARPDQVWMQGRVLD